MLKAITQPYPPRWVNAYVFDTLSQYQDVGVGPNQKISPIVASSPTNIEEIYKEVVSASKGGDPLLIQYDRMMRMRPNSFYPIKREQLLYYVYSTSLNNTNNASALIQGLLDREDASAEDLNLWTAHNTQIVDKTITACNVFFHTTKAYQTEDARTVQNLISTRSLYVNKLIIEYDYHSSDGSTFR